MAESHWTNPQYVMKLQDTDDDDDNVCSMIVQLMQKGMRRELKPKGEKSKLIGFYIYKVGNIFMVSLANYSLPDYLPGLGNILF